MTDDTTWGVSPEEFKQAFDELPDEVDLQGLEPMDLLGVIEPPTE